MSGPLAVGGSALIMIAALRHFQRLRLAFAAHPVDQPMLLVDPPRPPSREVAAEGLGLAGAAKRVAHAFLQQGAEPGQQFLVLGLPVEIFAPGTFGEDRFHGSIRSRSIPLPASSSAMLLSRRAAL